jgi:hypothetical protein
MQAQGAVQAFDRNRLTFVELAAGQRLQACDIRTGPTGETELEAEEVRISLSHGARGKVTPAPEGVTVEISSGSAQVRARDAAQVNVVSPHVEVHSRGGDVRVDVSAAATVVTSLSGSAEISTKSGSAVLRAGETRRVGRSRVLLPTLPVSLQNQSATGGTLTVPGPRGRPVPLRVADLTIHVIIDGRVALTRVDQTFANDSNQRCEGRYSFTLPPGATLSRYAMFTERTRLVEGEIVDRERGRHIYREIVRRLRDPALVEWQQGNLFSAKIFPIDPHSEKRVLLSYTQVLPRRAGRASYTFPLASGLTRENPIGQLRVTVEFTGQGFPHGVTVLPIAGVNPGEVISAYGAPWILEGTDVFPGSDLTLTLDYIPLDEPTLKCHRRKGDKEGFFLLALPADPGANPETALPCDLAVYVDTSLSRAGLLHTLQIRSVAYLLSQLDPCDRFRLYTFDSAVRPLTGLVAPTAAARTEALDALTRLVPLGGSNIEEAVVSAGSFLSNQTPGRRRAAVLITDGMASLGARSPSDIVRGLGLNSCNAPLHVLAVGSPLDRRVLGGLARRTGGIMVEALHPAAFDRGLLDLAVAVAGGLRPREMAGIEGKEITLCGASLEDRLPPGEERFAMGRYKPKSSMTVRCQSRAFTFTFPSETVSKNTFVPRLWASARMNELLQRDQTASIVKEVSLLSREFTLLCPYTSFLVLEKDEDYRQWGIDRHLRRSYFKPWNPSPRPSRQTVSRAPALPFLPRVDACEAKEKPAPRPAGLADVSFEDLLYNTQAGGRLITTATAVLCLEVYYRYGRILSKKSGSKPSDAEVSPGWRPKTRAPRPSGDSPASRSGRSFVAGANDERIDEDMKTVPATGRTSETKKAANERFIFRADKKIAIEPHPQEDPALADLVAAGDEISDENVRHIAGMSVKGIEDAISDKPFNGSYWNSAIGIGGGAGGVFGGRFGGRRNLRAYGGGRRTESAVLMGLSMHHKLLGDVRKRNSLEKALYLLSLLGAGHTHRHGKFKRTVKALLKSLMEGQDENGFFGGAPPGLAGVTHALATQAWAEAYGLSGRTPLLESITRKSVKALLSLQTESGGFTRYHGAPADTVATTFAVLALKSAKLSGITVPRKSFERAMAFFNACAGDVPGSMGLYRRPGNRDEWDLTSIAGAAIARIFVLGNRTSRSPASLGAAAIICNNLPNVTGSEYHRNTTYLYFANLAMFQMGGRWWKTWNPALKNFLVPTQLRKGEWNGTWDPLPSYLLSHLLVVPRVREADLRRALMRIEGEPTRFRLHEAARLLSAVRDSRLLTELTYDHPVGTSAGQLVRMRLGVLRVLAEDYHRAVDLVAEAYAAAGGPVTFLSLYVKALVGAEQTPEAIDLLATEAAGTGLNAGFQRVLASLLIRKDGGVSDPVGYALALAKSTDEVPVPLFESLTYLLEGDASLRMAVALLRASEWDVRFIPVVVRRLSGKDKFARLLGLYLESYGRQGCIPLALELGREAERMAAIDRGFILPRLTDALAGDELAGPRQTALTVFALRTLQKKAPLAVAALNRLAQERGLSAALLRKLQEACLSAGLMSQAAWAAQELIRAGFGSDEELRVLERTIVSGDAASGRAARILTSTVELHPFDMTFMTATEKRLRKTGCKADADLLRADAYVLMPMSPEGGIALARAIRHVRPHVYDRLLLSALSRTNKKELSDVWRRHPRALRDLFNVLRKRGLGDGITQLEKQIYGK